MNDNQIRTEMLLATIADTVCDLGTIAGKDVSVIAIRDNRMCFSLDGKADSNLVFVTVEDAEAVAIKLTHTTYNEVILGEASFSNIDPTTVGLTAGRMLFS